MELENERKIQVDIVLAKYAIASLEDAKRMCDDKNIDVEAIVKTIKPEACELAILAYTLGTAIAIKKDTKLSTYAAMDVGEGIQAFCAVGTEGEENRAGLGHGYQASNFIKNNDTLEEDANDYSIELSFMELSNDEMLRITSLLSKEIEKNV